MDGLANQECPSRLILQFIDQGSVQGLDPSCVTTMKRPPFVIREEEMRYKRRGADREGQ